MGSINTLVSLIGVLFVFSITTTCVLGNNGSPFIGSRGSQFVLRGSSTPFLFNGFNSYWMMHVASNPSRRYQVSQVFRQASAAGLTVCRTWAFGDGDGDLQISPGIYDERVFQALDFVISEAAKYRIRLILSLVNNYHDFGGRPQYVAWARTAGAHIVNGDDDFYIHPVVKTYYKNHVRSVVTRFNTITRIAYRDDPTIMAWELINEPRCQSDYSGRTINNWVQEMAPFLKSLDRNHLVEIGMEGFYGDTMPQRKQSVNPGYQVGTDYITNNLVAGIDFATIHAYPDAWLSGKTEVEQMEFMERWMSTHWEDAKTILKKPLVIAEFGMSSKHPGFTLAQREAYMSNVYRQVYRMARTGGAMSGTLVWQLMAEAMEADYGDDYQIVLSRMPSTAVLMSRQSAAMTALCHLSFHH